MHIIHSHVDGSSTIISRGEVYQEAVYRLSGRALAKSVCRLSTPKWGTYALKFLDCECQLTQNAASWLKQDGTTFALSLTETVVTPVLKFILLFLAVLNAEWQWITIVFYKV
jgi:hypothetical protein